MVPAKNADKKWRYRLFRYAPFVVWVLLIFWASTSQGSMSQTSFFVRPIIEFLFPGATEEVIARYHFYLRKFAHIFLYAVLGLLSSRALWDSGKYYLRNYWPAVSILLVIAISATDEINQSLNTIRTGSIYDVMLDCVGGFSAVALLAASKRFRNN